MSNDDLKVFPASAGTFEDFEISARALGFDEAVVRDWAPDTVLPEHTHPFEANALVTKGEMWLTCEGQTRHLGPGDTFLVRPEGRDLLGGPAQSALKACGCISRWRFARAGGRTARRR